MSKIDETNQMLLQESKDRRKNLDDPLKSLYSLFKSQYSMNTFAEIKNELLIIGFFHVILDAILCRHISLASFLSATVVLCFSFEGVFGRVNNLVIPTFVTVIALISFWQFDSSGLLLYTPQLILITSNKVAFAIVVQVASFMLVYCFGKRETLPEAGLCFSVVCLMLLLLIKKQILAKSSLHGKLRAENDSLKAQMQHLQDKLEKRKIFHRKFILSLSHEFRNPLNNIMGNIELTQKALAETTNANYEQLKNAKIGCETLLNFLNNVLDYSKIEANELDIHYISSNIRKGLEKGWSLFMDILKQKGLQGELYLHKNTPTFLMMDPCRIHQILLNLVQNSVKLTQRGFVRIIISWHPDSLQEREFSRKRGHPRASSCEAKKGPDSEKEVSLTDFSSPKEGGEFEDDYPSEFSNTITFSPSMNYFKLDMKTKRFPKGNHQKVYNPDDQHSGYLKMQVIDSGNGIPANLLPSLFSKNVKFNPEVNQKVEGGGLSLWITKNLCQKMDGDIRAYSEFHKGSTFLVVLKAEISPQSIGTPTPSPYNASTARPKITSMGTMKFPGLGPRLSSKNQAESLVQSETSIKKDEAKLIAMVVDDMPYNQQLNKQFLEVCGVEVKFVANNGAEAYNEISKYPHPPYDLVFMDIDMPVMDGKECGAKVREFEKLNKLNPLILVILSGNCTENELRQCLDKKGAVRANYFYRKPMSLFDCQNLIRLIKREKTKKMNSAVPNLNIFSNHILIYEKDIFQQVLLENYLKVGQIRYKISSKEEIKKTFASSPDTVNAILYNCEGQLEDCMQFAKEIKCLFDTKHVRRVPLFGIIEKNDANRIETLKKAGFKDFLIKPFDYENVLNLLSYPMSQSQNIFSFS